MNPKTFEVNPIVNEHEIQVTPLDGPAFERHFRPTELAKMWGLSVDIIRRLFEGEQGVIRIGHSEQLYKRKYVSLSIPESVAMRVHRRLEQPLNSRVV